KPSDAPPCWRSLPSACSTSGCARWRNSPDCQKPTAPRRPQETSRPRTTNPSHFLNALFRTGVYSRSRVAVRARGVFLHGAMPMYAIVETGGKQYRVKPGDTIAVERLSGEPGEVIDLGRVLLVAGNAGTNARIGAPGVESA